MSDAALRMDRMYRWQSAIYDLTRAPYLLGRNALIDALAPHPGATVLEIGCGTGRNLVRAARVWPQARFFGADVSSVMLEAARKSVVRAGLQDRITLAQANAETDDPRSVFNVERFDRVYVSYVLSMIPQWETALARAAALLEPGASLHIADFGDQRDLSGPARSLLNAWLGLFDVHPRREMADALTRLAAADGLACTTRSLHGGYAMLGSLTRLVNEH